MDPIPRPLSQRSKITVVLGLLGVLGYFGWFQLIRDEPARMPAGFILAEPLPPVPDAENGLVYLDAEIEKEIWPEIEKEQREIMAWRERWSEERMQPLIEAAPSMREIVDKALRFSGWRTESGPGSRSFHQAQQLAESFLRAKVRQFVEINNAGAAMDWLEPMWQLSRRLEKTPVSMASYMIAVGTNRVGDATLMRVLSRPEANDAMLARGMLWLASPAALPQEMVKALARDYRLDAELWFDPRENPNLKLGAIFGLIDGKEVPDWVVKSRFKPQAYHNLMLRQLALLDRLTKTPEPGGLRQLRAARDWLESESKLSVWSLEPNRAGRILAATSHVYFKMAESIRSCDAFRGCCRAAIAAKRWSLVNGDKKVPAIADLVPEFLPAEPLDPYDGQPLRWDAATGTAYSIGPDGIDNLPTFKTGEIGAFGEQGVAARLP